MNQQDRIRNRKSYQEFLKLLEFFNKQPNPSTFLRKVHSTLDEHGGFHSATQSYYAMESLNQVIEDKGLETIEKSKGDEK